MTDKKRRARGSRTHGGGTHKNRRGAGNRGGRGNAGRSKHQIHGQEPLGKHGFKRPSAVEREVAEIDLRTLDERAPELAEAGLAEETADGYRVDARDVVDGGHDADVVKVLGSGQARRALEVTADAFSDTATERIEAAGGSTALSERGQAAAEADAEDDEAPTED
ncbi:MAG: uL15m family ribosomal protein [Halobacteriales archaeon]|nr:uL15m family ribosomal protein [Halobacteriales archaeon]